MIDRLRTWARNGHTPKALADDLKDAADEIERLRAALEGLIDVARGDVSRDLLPTAIETIARSALKEGK